MTYFVVLSILFVLGLIAWATNPQPAEQSAARAYELYNRVAFTIGTKVANVINVAMQLKDARGQNIAQVGYARIYLSGAASGIGLTTTTPTSTLAVGTNGTIIVVAVTDKCLDVISDAQGRVDINITQTASPVTYFVVVQMPDGSQVVSGAVTF